MCYHAAMNKTIFTRKRLVWGCVILALAILLSWRPSNEALLFNALPDDAILASYHCGIASEWHALARHPMLIEALQNAGVDEAADLAEEDGFYQTLFWLTGSQTTLALSFQNPEHPLNPTNLLNPLNPLNPENHENHGNHENHENHENLFNPLPLQTLLTLATSATSGTSGTSGTSATSATSPLSLSDLRLSGVSYVGWKRRPMELLWRICYVPGLGKLDVTPSGTRYLVFRNSKTLRRQGLVLSLDMVDGHLFAVLSTDPDAVVSLVAQAREHANDPVSAWQSPDAANTVRILKQYTLSIPTFKTPDRLSLRVASCESPADIPFPAATARVAHDEGCPVYASLAVSPSLFLEDAQTSEPAFALLYGGDEVPSTFCGFVLPGLVALLPKSLPDPRGSIQSLIDSQFEPDAKRPVLEDVGGGLTRIDFRPLFKGSFIKPAKEEEPFLFVSPNGSAPTLLGSCLSSYQAFGTNQLVSVFVEESSIRWTASTPCLALGWIDLTSTASGFRNITALLNLAATFLGDNGPALRSFAETANAALNTASSLGTLDFTFRQPFCLDATFSRP